MSTLSNIAGGNASKLAADKTKEITEDEKSGIVTRVAIDPIVYIFMSDKDMPVFETFDEKITTYSQLFINRTLEDLVERNITKIWLNISNKDQKYWFKTQIGENCN